MFVIFVLFTEIKYLMELSIYLEVYHAAAIAFPRKLCNHVTHGKEFKFSLHLLKYVELN